MRVLVTIVGVNVIGLKQRPRGSIFANTSQNLAENLGSIPIGCSCIYGRF